MVALLSSISLYGCNNSENEESSNVSDTSLVSDVSAEVKVSIGGIEDGDNSEPLVSVPTDDEKLASDVNEASELLKEVTKLGSKGDKLFKVLNSDTFTVQLDETSLFGDKVTYFITRDKDNYYMEDCNSGEKVLYTNKKGYLILDSSKEVIDIDKDTEIVTPNDWIPDYNGYTFKSSKTEDYEGVSYTCETYVTNDVLYADERQTQLGLKEIGSLKIYYDNDTPKIMEYTYTDYDGSTVIKLSKYSENANKSYFKVPNYKHISVSEYQKKYSGM